MRLISVWWNNIVQLDVVCSAEFYHTSHLGQATTDRNDYQEGFRTVSQTGSEAVSKAHWRNWESHAKQEWVDRNEILSTAEYRSVIGSGKKDNLKLKELRYAWNSSPSFQSATLLLYP